MRENQHSTSYCWEWCPNMRCNRIFIVINIPIIKAASTKYKKYHSYYLSESKLSDYSIHHDIGNIL